MDKARQWVRWILGQQQAVKAERSRIYALVMQVMERHESPDVQLALGELLVLMDEQKTINTGSAE